MSKEGAMGLLALDATLVVPPAYFAWKNTGGICGKVAETVLNGLGDLTMDAGCYIEKFDSWGGNIQAFSATALTVGIVAGIGLLAYSVFAD